MNIVKLHEQPPLSDIPERLKYLGQRMLDLANEMGLPRTALVVIYNRDGTVTTKCFGDNPPRCEVLGLLQMAAENILDDMKGAT